MRIKRGVNAVKKRRKILKSAKGYFGAKSKLYRTAREQVMKSGQYSYIGRKQKKRDFRALWITRINAGCHATEFLTADLSLVLKKQTSRSTVKCLQIWQLESQRLLLTLLKLQRRLNGKGDKEFYTKP